MSFSATTTTAGGGFPGGGGLPPPPFNFTPPGLYPQPSANSTSFITKSSTFTTTATSISSTTLSTSGPTIIVSVTPLQAASSDNALLESTASLTRTNIIITLVLGGVAIFLLVIIAILLGLYIRRRRREREENSPPFTSLAARSPRTPTFPRNTTQSAPQIPLDDFSGTSLSMGPQRNIYGAQALASHPPNRPSRSFSAPGPAPEITIPPPIPLFDGVPAIDIQPNTPSVLEHSDPRQVSPVSQPGPARMPLFREELQEPHPATSVLTGDAERLGVPGIMEGQRASVSTIGSDMEFERGAEITEERGNAGGVLHSTRASSGVFPEQ